MRRAFSKAALILVCACGSSPTGVPLAAGQNIPWAIAVDSTSVYWTDSIAGTVMKVGLSGGTPETLVNAREEGFFAIAVDATSVYFSAPGVIAKTDLSGGNEEFVASGTNVTVGLAVDSTSVYFADFQTVAKASLADGTLAILFQGQSDQPQSLALDATSVYWTDYNAGTVMKVGLAGGTPTTLASGLGAPAGIAVDSTSVYWTDFDSIAKVGLSGGTTVTLASGQSRPWSIAVDSTSVYWTSIGQADCGGAEMPCNGAVFKVGLAGGASVPLATGGAPTNLVVDSTSVYWTDPGTGTVRKAPK